MKRAVIYYSLSENTANVAKNISDRLGTDLIRIDTVKPMPEKFSQQIMFGGMQATFGLKPAIKDVPDNLSEYDEIIIGTPIWAGKHSPAINTLIGKYDIKEKITAVFLLSGSGENEKCFERLKKILPNLKYTVELTDRKSDKEEENKRKLDDFISRCMK